MKLAKQDFNFLRELIKKNSGISLSDEKEYLVESRLIPVLRERNILGFDQLVREIRANNDHDLINEVIESITTNETSFFRDIRPFEKLKENIIPHVVAKTVEPNIRIWSAACSTGQEPYSIAMTVLENQKLLEGRKAEIIGTDINKSVLKKCEEAIYSQFEVQRGLPVQHLIKYFVQEKSYGEKWILKDDVKKLVQFKILNLLEDCGSLGQFDIIFCRNVLIYFEQDTKSFILNKLCNALKKHGLLMLGSSETVMGLNDRLEIFESINGIYCLK